MPVAPSRVAEKKRVWRCRGGLGDDPVDRGLEAHVEHPVGLVEDEGVHLAEVERAALEQVLEATGGGDEDVGALGALDLRAEADAAVDGGDPEAARGGDRLQLVDDLAGQLAGRRQDQRRRAAGVGLDEIDQRHPEGQGLARAGRGLDEDVVAGEHVFDHEPLDGEGVFDTACGECAHDWFGHAEIGEGLRRHIC